MSEGLKEALEYAVNISEPHYTEHEGNKYADKEMYRIHSNLPKAQSIEMNTLSSLLDYIRSGTDSMQEKMIIHIQSPTKVSLYSQLDDDRRRENLVEVNALLPKFYFGKYYDTEEFVINVMSKFIGEKEPLPLQEVFDSDEPIKHNDKDIILKFAGTMESGTVAKYGDDGVSQKATIQQTVTSKEDVIVPNPVHLIPYRTFLEVEQPGSDFIFRVRDSRGDGPQAALFEADGGKWEIDAMRKIHEYLSKEIGEMELPEGVTFTIIS